MIRWSPFTWIAVATGAIAIPIALLLPEHERVPSLAIDRLPAREGNSDPVDRESRPASEPAVLAPLDRLTETTARPLFSTTRRPAPPEPPPALAPAPQPDPSPPPAPAPIERTEYVLVGIVDTAESPLVILRPRSGGPSVVVHVGDEIGGWVVEAATSTAVRLASDGESRKMVLFASRRADVASDEAAPVGAPQ